MDEHCCFVIWMQSLKMQAATMFSVGISCRDNCLPTSRATRTSLFFLSLTIDTELQDRLTLLTTCI